MANQRLLYSCGLELGRRGQGEILVDIKTMEACIGEKEKPVGDVWIILTGKRKAGGGYVCSKIPLKKLHKRYLELLEIHSGNEKVAIQALMDEYKFKPLGYYPAKYPDRYCAQG